MSKRPYLLALAFVAGGCAHHSPDAAAIADLRQQLDAQQRRTAAAEHKLDELENRVFLLTDQLESQKVATLHRERRSLPIVTLKPDAASSSAAATDDPTVDDGEEIVYEGEAKSDDPTRARPVLRIDGTRVASRRSAEPAARTAKIVSPSGEDNLGVAPVPPIHAAAPAERAAPAVEPLTLYRTAYDDLRAGKNEVAEREFREFVHRFPHHDYADNAQYWLGECFYDRKEFDKAASEFRAVVQRWPTGNKAPDALLKLGYSLLALGDVDKGRQALRELPATYPHTEAARLASERLAQLSTEGAK